MAHAGRKLFIRGKDELKGKKLRARQESIGEFVIGVWIGVQTAPAGMEMD